MQTKWNKANIFPAPVRGSERSKLAEQRGRFCHPSSYFRTFDTETRKTDDLVLVLSTVGRHERSLNHWVMTWNHLLHKSSQKSIRSIFNRHLISVVVSWLWVRSILRIRSFNGDHKANSVQNRKLWTLPGHCLNFSPATSSTFFVCGLTDSSKQLFKVSWAHRTLFWMMQLQNSDETVPRTPYRVSPLWIVFEWIGCSLPSDTLHDVNEFPPFLYPVTH